MKTYKVFWRLLHDHAPILYKNLKLNDAMMQTFLFPWVITLFSSSSFDINLNTYIWDQILFHGQLHILKVALAICQIVEEQFKGELLPSENCENIVDA